MDTVDPERAASARARLEIQDLLSARDQAVRAHGPVDLSRRPGPAMTTLEVLQQAHGLLTQPARWTTGAFARDAHGYRCHPETQGAVCWCLEGALLLACGGLGEDFVFATNAVLASQGKRWRTLMQINDHMGHEEVMLTLENAIRFQKEMV